MSMLSDFFGGSDRKDAKRLNAEAMATQQKSQKMVDDFVATIDPLKREMASKLAEAYTQTATMLDESIKRGDTKLETVYRDQLSLMSDAAKNQLGLAPRQYVDMQELLDTQAQKAVELIRSDVSANRKLQDVYKKQADTAIDTYNKGLESLKANISELRKSGLPAGAEQAIAKQEAAITTAKQNLARSEGLQLGGSRGRKLGLDIEAARAKGDLVSQLRQQGRAELQTDEERALATAGGLEALGQRRMAGLEETGGARELAARSPFMAASQANLGRLQATEADVQNQRMNLLTQKAGTDVALDQWAQSAKGQGLGMQVQQNTTMADLLSQQAAAASQRASQAMSRGIGLVTTLATAGAGAAMGGMGMLTSAGVNSAGQGAMYGLTGGAFGGSGKVNPYNATGGSTKGGNLAPVMPSAMQDIGRSDASMQYPIKFTPRTLS